jgi:crotonobetainyl-CoA:carnitine CoA-transferase CaiB-like acyl-CoA transferase
VVQAYAGLATLPGPDGDPPPPFVDQVVADRVTALTAAQAITAAMFARNNGHGGQHVEIAMLAQW